MLLQVGGIGNTGLPLPAAQILGHRLSVPKVGHDSLIVGTGAGVNAQLPVGIVTPNIDSTVVLQNYEVVLAYGDVHNAFIDAVPNDLGGNSALLQLVAGVAVHTITPGPQRAVSFKGDRGSLGGNHLRQSKASLGGSDIAHSLIIGRQHLHDKHAKHIALSIHACHSDLASLAEAGVSQSGPAHPPLAILLVDHQDTVITGDKLKAGIRLLQGDAVVRSIVGQQVEAVVVGQLRHIVDANVGILVFVPGQGDPGITALLEVVCILVGKGKLHYLCSPFTGIVGLFPPIRVGILRTVGSQAQLSVSIIAPGHHMAVLHEDSVVVSAGSRDKNLFRLAALSDGLAVHHDHMAILIGRPIA